MIFTKMSLTPNSNAAIIFYHDFKISLFPIQKDIANFSQPVFVI